MGAIIITSAKILDQEYKPGQKVKLHAAGRIFEAEPFEIVPVSDAEERLLVKFAQQHFIPLEAYRAEKHNKLVAAALGRQATSISLSKLEPFRKLTKDELKAATPEQLAEIAVAAGYAPNTEAATRLSIPARREIALAALGFIGAKEPAPAKPEGKE